MNANCRDGLLSLDTDDKHSMKKWMTEIWNAFIKYYVLSSTFNKQHCSLIKIVHICEKYQIKQLKCLQLGYV